MSRAGADGGLRGLRPGPAGLDVAGVGEAMLLFYPPTGESLSAATTVAVDVAGAELNACAAVARFGLATALCTRVGADPAGDRVRRVLAELGLLDTLVVADPDRPTGMFVRELLPDGARRAYYYRSTSAASRLDEADAERLLAARPRVVLVSGLTAALGDGPRRCVRALVERAREHEAAVVVDANLRPTLGGLDEVRDLLLAGLPRTDLLVLGTDEAEILLGTGEPAAVFARLASEGVGEVVLKAGADGAFHLGADGSVRHTPALAERVVDPVGAGDAFTGAYLATRLHGGSRADAVRVASRLAARIVEQAGDLTGLPTPAEAARLLADERSTPAER